MSWTLTTSGAAIFKAGKGAEISGAQLAVFSDQVEGAISAITKYDWVTNYSSVGTVYKGILNDVASDMIAMKAICYNMAGYTSRLEAQTMLDVYRDNINKNLDALKDFDTRVKMGAS